MDSGSYDAQDRLLKYSTSQYLYTANGELQKKVEGSDTTRYTYDYFGNLITVILPNKDRIDYLIDGQNRRIGKKINGLIIRRWIYSGQLSPIAELDSANNVRAQFVGSLMIKDGNTYQLITDHLGSIRLVVNVQTGETATRREYDEYGNITSDFDTLDIPFGFAGGLYDTQTKLTRFGARDYEASTGRWICKDPILFRGGIGNLYLYVGGDPINRTDPYGLQHWEYSQSSGQLNYVDQNGTRTPEGTGYSGHGEGLNNPDRQNQPNVGPIPQGTYEIGQAYDNQNTGPVTMNLTPIDNTDTFGRDLFRIHGDNARGDQSASRGCPVLSRPIREQISRSGTNTLRVVR